LKVNADYEILELEDHSTGSFGATRSGFKHRQRWSYGKIVVVGGTYDSVCNEYLALARYLGS
jgi:hypothetical protein